MSQKVLLDEDDAQAILNCLQVCKNTDALRLRALIEEKMKSTPLMDKLRQEGIENYTNEGEVEIDEGAVVSIDDTPGAEPDGAYVMGWVWVPVPDETEVPETNAPPQPPPPPPPINIVPPP